MSPEPESELKKIAVVGAVIVQDGRVLCAQRGQGSSLAGMWEFPGGKIEKGESPQEALAREVQEELHARVTVGDHVVTTTHEYEFGEVTLTTFFCELKGGWVQPSEHQELRWVSPEDLEELTWAPADVPAVARVRHLLWGA